MREEKRAIKRERENDGKIYRYRERDSERKRE